MKHTLFYISALLLLAACTSGDELMSYESDPDAVLVNAGVGSETFTRSNPMAADATNGLTTFNSGDVIAISNDGGSSFVNYAYSGSAWAPQTAGQYLKWSQTTMDFCAYYPADVSGTSMSSFTLPTDQSSTTGNIADADYMTYSGSVTNNNDNKLSIEMTRQMARVIVKIAAFEDQFSGSPAVSALTISSAYSGISSGNPSGDATAVTPYVTAGTSGTGYAGTTYTALLVPGAANSTETFINLTVTYGTDNSQTTTLAVTGIPTLEAGNSYTYSLTVGKDVVKIGSVTVTDWTTGETLSGGKAEQLEGYYCTTADLIEEWLTTNIGTQTEQTLYVMGAAEPSNGNDWWSALRVFLISTGTGSAAALSLDLTEVSGLTSVPNSALPNSTGLTSITFPDEVESIGNNAFYDCTSLTTISGDLSSLTTIGDAAFQGTAITSLSNLTSLTSIGDAAFYGSKLSEISGDLGSLKTIGYSAFRGSAIKSLSGMTSLTSIEDAAFLDCKSLTTINGDLSSLTDIGDAAFQNTAIESLSGMTNLKSIGSLAFYLSSLTTINGNLSSLETIGANAFQGTAITSLSGMTNLKSIGSNAFNDCTDLTISGDLSSLTDIGDNAFAGTAITSLTGLKVLGTIGTSAFFNCKSLTSISGDLSNLGIIGDNAFQGTAIASLSNLTSLKSIGNNAFSGCSTLTEISGISILETIGNRAFYGCTNLTEISGDLSTLTTIGDTAFLGSAITSLTGLKVLGSIGTSAFFDCKSLTALRFSACETVPALGDTVFGGTTGSIIVYLPDATSKSNFESNSYWSSYSNLTFEVNTTTE